MPDTMPRHIRVLALDAGAQPFVRETIHTITAVLRGCLLVAVDDFDIAEEPFRGATKSFSDALERGCITGVTFNAYAAERFHHRSNIQRAERTYDILLTTCAYSPLGVPGMSQPGTTYMNAVCSIVSSAVFVSLSVADQVKTVAMVAAHELGHIVLDAGDELHCPEPTCIFHEGSRSPVENVLRMRKVFQSLTNAYCLACRRRVREKRLSQG